MQSVSMQFGQRLLAAMVVTAALAAGFTTVVRLPLPGGAIPDGIVFERASAQRWTAQASTYRAALEAHRLSIATPAGGDVQMSIEDARRVPAS